jgi:hypothetical protein
LSKGLRYTIISAKKIQQLFVSKIKWGEAIKGTKVYIHLEVKKQTYFTTMTLKQIFSCLDLKSFAITVFITIYHFPFSIVGPLGAKTKKTKC